MRHRKIGRSFSKNWSHRKALFRNMVTSLLEVERIVTTDAKAKELRRVAEKIITLGKQGTLHARRRAAAFVRTPAAVSKLFADLGPHYQNRAGGYTRIIKLGRRPGDNAPQSLIELVDREKVAKPAKKEAPPKKSAPPPAPKKPKAPAEKKAAAKPAKKAPAKKAKPAAKKAGPAKKKTAKKADKKK